MNVLFSSRWRQALAAGVISLPTAAVAAEPEPAAGPRTMEILHGTRKVWPVPAPVAPAPAPRPVAPAPAPVAPVREVVQTAGTLESDNPSRVTESRTIIFAGTAAPYPVMTPGSAPWLSSGQFAPVAPPASQPATPTTPAQPTIVVIREPVSEPRPAADPARGVTVGSEVLLGIGLGAAGLGFGYAGWNRRRPVPSVEATPPAAPQKPSGVLLLGEFDAGPLPTTAEKFDMGPSYQTVQQEKKKTEEQNQAAVLEFILSQNLALQDEFPDPDDLLPPAVPIDPE